MAEVEGRQGEAGVSHEEGDEAGKLTTWGKGVGRKRGDDGGWC